MLTVRQRKKEYFEQAAPVHRVDVDLVKQEGLSLEFTVHGSWPSTCFRFSHFEVEESERAYDVELINRHPVVGVGGDAIVMIEEEWSVTVPEPGTYTFRFSRGEQAPLDTTITIP